jgi:hypothetical protein
MLVFFDQRLARPFGFVCNEKPHGFPPSYQVMTGRSTVAIWLRLMGPK